MKLKSFLFSFAVMMACFLGQDVAAQTKTAKVQWSNYIGWIGLQKAKDWGILDKHASAAGMKVELLQFDYVSTVDNFCSGAADAVAVANTELFGQIAGLQRKTRVFMTGDYSEGNDGVVAGKDVNVNDTAATYPVFLVENSVNEIMFDLWREREKPKCKFNFINADENTIRDQFVANPKAKIAVLWNPMLMRAAQRAGTVIFATSAEFPGMITDHYAMSEKAYLKFPELPKVLAHSIYDVRRIIASATGESLEKIYNEMKDYAGASATEVREMQKTTHYFLTPEEGAEFTSGQEFREKSEVVRQMCARAGLLGEGRKLESYGVRYADGTVTGNAENVIITFDATTMQELSGGK